MNKTLKTANSVSQRDNLTSALDGARASEGRLMVREKAASFVSIDELLFGTSAPRRLHAVAAPTSPTTPAVLTGNEAMTTIEQMASVIAHDALEDEAAQQLVDGQLDFSPGELGHGERFVDSWGHCTRFDATRGTWMIWRGNHWAVDEANEVVLRMTRVAKNILNSESAAMQACAKQFDDPYLDAARKVYAEGLKLHNFRTISAALQIARVLPGMTTRASQYDADPMVFNCESGVIDLRTGLMSQHRSESLLTKISPLRLGDADSKCPRWMQFLDEITCGDKELVDYLQRVVGYILTGSMREQCFFLFYGAGANGKSTFINVIKHLMGDYGQQVDFTTFMDMNRGASPRNDLASLVGRRFVVSPEGMDGKALDEPVVKQFTGGDPMTVRFLNKEFFTFQPVGKIVLASNHRPLVKGTDHGIWRRMRLVPFLAKFDASTADQNLLEKLIAEGSAILRWAVEGSQLWAAQGLGIPTAVAVATMSYRSSMDIFQTFIDERCTVDFKSSTGSQVIYDAYSDWCVSAGIRMPMKQSIFNQRLEERGFERKKTSAQNVWLGVALKPVTHTVFGVSDSARSNANGYSKPGGELNF